MVYHLPNSSGRSRHGAPVRATHNTPSTNRRLSSPRRPGSPIFPGSSGAIRSHWALLNTVRIKADLPFFSLESAFQISVNPAPDTVYKQALACEMGDAQGNRELRSTGDGAPAFGALAPPAATPNRCLRAKPRRLRQSGRGIQPRRRYL